MESPSRAGTVISPHRFRAAGPTDQAADFPVRHVGKSATNSSFRGANDARVQPAIRAASRLSVARAAVRPECWQQRSLRSCRSEEHTSELQSLMRNSYAVFCLKKKNKKN